MIELLVLIAIAYAGARGVESVTGIDNHRYDSPAAQEAVAEAAGDSPAKGADPKPPSPTDPGGTFSAAAPRSAQLGGKAAVPLAVLAETSSTMWKAVGEGYRERWPEIRAERRKQMAERAAKRAADKAAAQAAKKAAEALAAAGPPPLFPPKPGQPPTVPAPPLQPTPATTVKIPASVPAPTGPAPDLTVLGWPGDGTALIPTQTPLIRHLTAVPDTTGDLMSAPSKIIPEVRTLDGLLNALTVTRAMCEMRAEEALAIAADDLTLSSRLDEIEAEMAELEVDASTRAEIDALRESIHAQSQAAGQYGHAAKDAADLALAAAQAAHKNHGGIAEAVQSSPIDVAAQAGYYNR